MKKIILASLSIGLFFAACVKEQVPAGLQLTGGGIQVGDTTYVLTTVPTPQTKNVLVEEYTGVRCPNCPQAAAALVALQKAQPNRIFATRIHTGGLAIPYNNDPDFRNDQAVEIDNAFGGSAQGQPAAAIDRVLNVSTGKYSYPFSTGTWPTLINQELALPSAINLDLSKKVTGNDIQAVCNITFTDTTSQPISFCVYLTEGGITAWQDSTYISGGFPVKDTLENYVHEEIFRFTPTPAVVGTNLPAPVAPATVYEKGRTFVRVLNFTKPANVIDLSKCHLILFVQNATSKKVLQATEIHL